MSVPKDLIIVVPPGTRVRFMESPVVGDRFVALDADAFKVVAPSPLGLFTSTPFFDGIPVFDAERVRPDRQVGE